MTTRQATACTRNLITGASLEELRRRETKLEAEIAEEKREWNRVTSNLGELGAQLSEIKKAIAPLALGTPRYEAIQNHQGPHCENPRRTKIALGKVQ